MGTFTENFKTQWAKSFGEDKPVRGTLSPGIYPEGTEAPLETPAPVGILKRVWNDAVRGGSHKEQELETPAVISVARGIGKTLGIGTALGTVCTMAAGFFTSTAAIPVLPFIGSLMGLGTLGGAIYGIFTKPEAKKPYEQLVHVDRGAGVRDYDMVTVQSSPINWKDKFAHITQCVDYGVKLPLVAAYRVINTPIRLTGYAAHAFGTAVAAAVETYKENHAAPAPAAAGHPPADKNDFTM
jgi:hypothetical protein